jgi:hypothetical protein
LSGVENARAITGTLAHAAEELDNEYIILSLIQYYKDKGHDLNFDTLGPYLETYNYVLLDGRRITSTEHNRSRNFGSCLVYSDFRSKGFAGELQMVFKHKQLGVAESSETIFAFIRWMKRSKLTPLEAGRFMWDDL